MLFDENNKMNKFQIDQKFKCLLSYFAPRLSQVSSIKKSLFFIIFIKIFMLVDVQNVYAHNCFCFYLSFFLNLQYLYSLCEVQHPQIQVLSYFEQLAITVDQQTAGIITSSPFLIFLLKDLIIKIPLID